MHAHMHCAQVLDTAAKYRLRLVIALVNNWAQDSNADNKCALWTSPCFRAEHTSYLRDHLLCQTLSTCRQWVVPKRACTAPAGHCCAVPQLGVREEGHAGCWMSAHGCVVAQSGAVHDAVISRGVVSEPSRFFPLRRAFYTGSEASADNFFNSSSAKQAYKNHLKVVVNRRNTINGKVCFLL